MATMTTSNLPSPVQIYYDRLLLSMADPNLIHSKIAMKKNIPSNSGGTLRCERYGDIGIANVPLGNTSITPPSSAMSSVFIDAKLNWYGQWIEIDHQVDKTSQSPVLNQRTMLLGRAMRQTEDALVRDMLATTATVIFATGGVNGKEIH